jgi:K+ transporter
MVRSLLEFSDISTGDIGTSPLYVFTGYTSQAFLLLTYRIFPNSTGPAPEDVVGAASCIVWSLTLVPLIKYSWLVLRAGDDQGEGISTLIDCSHKAALLCYI